MRRHLVVTAVVTLVLLYAHPHVSTASHDPADEDHDGVKNGIEVAAGTNPNGGSGYPAGMDTDGDGCPNEREKSSDATLGGQRHPGNYWDFFDVQGDGAVDLHDALAILGHFGHMADTDALDQRLDRQTALVGGPPAFLLESNDGVDLTDVLRNLGQFGHGCGTGAGPTPPPGGGIYD